MTPEAMAAIHAASFTTPRPWSAADIAATLDSRFAFLLTETDGFLIGRCVAGEAEILTLAVAPSARQKGIGGRLVEAFFSAAQARGAESAFLEVSAANLPAQALYLAKGFEAQGKRAGYYQTPEGARLDALVMVRRI
jgi:[ribosomal protein S18]-alanine N-acetyltransferase